MNSDRPGLRLGLVVLDGDDAIDTLGLPDPFNSVTPKGLPSTSMTHPDFWSVPTAFAVAANATVTELVKGSDIAIKGVLSAIDRLAPHCNLILGNCGYMYWVVERELLNTDTPTFLSGLQLLPHALASTSRPVGVLTFNLAATEKMLASHPQRSRLRLVGLDDKPVWGILASDDWRSRYPSRELLRSELFHVCLDERRNGDLADIGGLVLECTALAQFRGELAAALGLPVWDLAGVARSLLGN